MAPSDPYGPSPTWWRQRSFAVPAIGIAVVLLLAAVILVGGHSQHQAGPPARPRAAHPAAAPPAGTPAPSNQLDNQDQTIPTSAPAGVVWKSYDTALLPYSPTAGPTTVVPNGMASGYAHTPTGALIALVQIDARKGTSPDWRSIAAAQVMPGPGLTAFDAYMAQVTDTGPAQPGSWEQIAGFQFVTYSPALAVVEIVTSAPAGSAGGYQVRTETAAWSNGDWRQVLQPDATDTPSIQPISSLAGFVIWGGI